MGSTSKGKAEILIRKEEVVSSILISSTRKTLENA